jgi:hypothetical protein
VIAIESRRCATRAIASAAGSHTVATGYLGAAGEVLCRATSGMHDAIESPSAVECYSWHARCIALSATDSRPCARDGPSISTRRSPTAPALRLEADFTYGAGIDASPEAPVGVCVSIADRAPLRDPESGELTGDTLFLTLGGLPRGSIC